MPVEAIPIVRTRAPETYELLVGSDGALERSASLSSRDASIVATEGGPSPLLPMAHLHQQHRPREGRPGLDHLAVASQQTNELILGPVVHVARSVTQISHIGTASQVQRAPQGLA